MAMVKCPECWYPRVNCVWDEDSRRWTGRCSECDSIIFASKEVVTFTNE